MAFYTGWKNKAAMRDFDSSSILLFYECSMNEMWKIELNGVKSRSNFVEKEEKQRRKYVQKMEW